METKIARKLKSTPFIAAGLDSHPGNPGWKGGEMVKYAFSAMFIAVAGLSFAAQAADYALSPDGTAVVRIVPQSTIAASTFNNGLLTGGYSSTTGTGGSLSVTSYTSGFSGGLGGAQFQALYDRGSALGTGQSLEWTQVITTNEPLGGATSPHLDNAGKPSEPYYTYTAANRNSSLPADKLNFYDFSKRDPATLATTNPITWNANLYPVIRDSTTAFTVLDGVSWGWTMKKATVGADTGIFMNPGPASVTVNGVGTSTFSWGVAQPDQSSLSFSGGAFDTSPNTPFKLGKLTFHNGTIASDTGATSVTLDVSMNFTNVPEKNFDLNIPLTIVNTVNTSDPIASADYVTINGYGFTFNVLEGTTAAVDIYAKLTTGLSAIPNVTMPSGQS